MPFAPSSSGRTIYYERSGTGTGPAVLFCHGAGSNIASWWQQLPVFGAHHSCLSIELRCFGRSAAPIEEFQLRLFVDDVIAVLDHAGVDRVAFVGQSLGGMVGLRTALWHPQRVSAFVAAGSSLAIDHPLLVAAVEGHLRRVPVASIEQRAFSAWFNAEHPQLAALYAHIGRFNPNAHSIGRDAWSAAMASLNTLASLLPTEALRGLACPTLFILGSEDPVVPLQAVEDLSKLVPGCERVVLQRSGHVAYYEQPERFNQAVLDFLARRVLCSLRS